MYIVQVNRHLSRLIFLPNGSWQQEILKIKINPPPVLEFEPSLNLWLMRPELYHETTLASESEGY